MAQKQHIMEDKEIGELWKWVTAGEAAYISPEEGQELIRKLVEESALLSQSACIFDNHDDQPCSLPYHRGLVLNRFGIDPETWK